MSSIRASFTAGVAAIAPILIGLVPFGLIYGIAAVDAGIGPGAGIGMSLLVFVGAAQLATADLIGSGAAPAVIVLTALIINARMMMYSASLAPHLAGARPAAKVGLAYILTDQAYAVSITEYARSGGDLQHRVAFYTGASIPLWITWQICTVIGIALGTNVPASWSLDFAIPLVFLALLVPAINDRSAGAAAALGGGVAALTAGLPLNVGLMTGALIGILAGVITERLTPPGRSETV